MSRKVIGIAGHAGIGHVNGVAGCIQDDSAGVITVSSMIAYCGKHPILTGVA
jgi:hypothetical protein